MKVSVNKHAATMLVMYELHQAFGVTHKHTDVACEPRNVQCIALPELAVESRTASIVEQP